MKDDAFVDFLIREVGPRFEAALPGVESAAPAARMAAGPASAIGARLAGPILRLAAGLILRAIRREARVVLDAEEAAHPGLDLGLFRRFIDSMGAGAVEEGA